MYINQKSFLNMKQINKLLVILLALVTFSSCETYGDYEIEYTAIYPLCGEWVVNVTGEDGGVLAEGVTCNTYNTTDDATDKMWIKMSVATNDWEYVARFIAMSLLNLLMGMVSLICSMRMMV